MIKREDYPSIVCDGMQVFAVSGLGGRKQVRIITTEQRLIEGQKKESYFDLFSEIKR